MSRGKIGGMPADGLPRDRSFLRLLLEMAEASPGRAALEEALDRLLEAVGGERAFLFRIRRGGGFRVLLARNRDREPIRRPAVRLSHYAVRLALEGKGPHFVENARRDRRYRTEESLRTRRQPVSILVLPLLLRGGVEGGVYVDHRFRPITASGAALEAAEHWRALLGIGLNARERERLLGRREAALPVLPGPPPLAASLVPPEPAEVIDFHGLLAASPDMLDLVDLAGRLGKSDLPVVIQGETGTGKEVLARAIHRASSRADRPFLVVNCGGIPDALLESELFGHARGAFTGAEAERRGLLPEADGGTLLLDEVGDMSDQMQQKLLHFLADGRVRPLGQKAPFRIDVRILASTHRDLARWVEEGRFRKDLFYRLRGSVLSVPPLRERREEVLPLAARFLERFARDEGREPPVLGPAARRRLVQHHWPGNARELENEMRRLAGLGLALVEEDQLSPFLRGAGDGGQGSPRGVKPLLISRVVAEAEREAIRKALDRAAGNKSQAARLLGITRKALYRRLARYRMLRGGEGAAAGA
jgi:DNA-binding NtrC family response regulator